MPAASKPIGHATRGTTNPNRLRRVDRYLAGPLAPLLRRADAPVVVDLGFGAAHWTTVEMRQRLAAVVPGVRVVGVEIDPARVAAALPWRGDGLDFVVGGFETPVPAGWPRPVIVRAANVLRQYDEADVAAAWGRITAGLAPGGVLLDGTCDEIGRRHAWVVVGAEGPRTLTISLDLTAVERPSDVAERLPKALIHHNVPGERIHAWLQALDRAWERHAPLSPFGVRQRWLATVASVRDAGWPVCDDARRWRLGELTVCWEAVAP